MDAQRLERLHIEMGGRASSKKESGPRAYLRGRGWSDTAHENPIG